MSPVKENQFVQLSGGTRSVNRELEDNARALAGIKGYVTNLRACPDGAPSPRSSSPAPTTGCSRSSARSGWPRATCRPGRPAAASATRIEAHLTIVFAALAISRWIERQTGWSIRKFVKTARRYRTIQIQAGPHTITTADPVPKNSARPSKRSTAPADRHLLLAVS